LCQDAAANRQGTPPGSHWNAALKYNGKNTIPVTIQPYNNKTTLYRQDKEHSIMTQEKQKDSTMSVSFYQS